jgi:TrmH family RNA methyltransferase
VASLPPLTPLTGRSGRLKQARRLARRRFRTEDGRFLAEGAKALSEALLVPGNVVEVFATEAASAEHAELRDAAEVPWHLTEPDALASLAGAVTPQGLVAVCRHLDVPLDDLLSLEGDLVLCADVRDPGNAGTVIRTADAAGAAGVALTGESVDLYNDKTVRASVGSLWHLPLALAHDTVAAVRLAQASGRVVLAADGAGETDLFDAEAAGLLDQPVAWLFGNEAWGLPDHVAALADHRVAIPIRGRAESLNLATAAAVCLYATARRR